MEHTGPVLLIDICMCLLDHCSEELTEAHTHSYIFMCIYVLKKQSKAAKRPEVLSRHQHFPKAPEVQM